MKTNLSIFAQIIRLIPRDIIHKNIDDHDSDFNSKGINAWTHLVSMLYCQFGNCQSIRDISFGLRSITGNLNHLGVSRAPSKSSRSYINVSLRLCAYCFPGMSEIFLIQNLLDEKAGVDQAAERDVIPYRAMAGKWEDSTVILQRK